MVLSNNNSFDRNEINKFIKEKFDINTENYNDEQLNDLIIKINKVLDKKISEEEQELLRLKKQLENEEMYLDSLSSETN